MHGRIALEGVGMRFRLHRERPTTLKETLLRGFRRGGKDDDLWAVRGISLAAGPGETVGVVGRNGSGKSTLLRIAAGILRPTEGTLRVEGRVSPMIELAAGFDPELTGRENVFLAGALLGHSRREMATKLHRIVEFSELRPFLDVPVKNYSSGMYARLGFAIAADVDPDLLLVDEVLAVGDEPFQAKCVERIRTIQRRGATVLLVSHDLALVQALCTRAVVLERGRVVFDGPPSAGVARLREIEAGAAPVALVR
jgi:ABC-type polysaccharide/polyol phosphate transport system ATPase subunit